MKSIYYSILITCCCNISTFAQMSISPNNTSPDASAMLDIASTTQGFLMPRMTESQRVAINSPAEGLLLFQTNNSPGLYFNRGTSSSAEWITTSTNDILTECDKRIPLNSVSTSGDGYGYTISSPGSYYLTDTIYVLTSNADGIIIDANNVTLDLNGYSLIGTDATDDGIVVNGDQDNIVIKNGTITGWGGDGINGLNADQSTFENLTLSDNAENGLVADHNCLIINCHAKNNGSDGFDSDDGTIIYNSTASYNGYNGIQARDGSIVMECTSIGNDSDGIDVFYGSRVENCTVFENKRYGIDIALGGQVINCSSYRNGWHGIDVSNTCIVMNCISNDNGQCYINGDCDPNVDRPTSRGAGIRTFANSNIINNSCSGNYIGIVISSTDSEVVGNYLIGNKHTGLIITSSGGFAVKNICHNNGFDPLTTFDNNMYSIYSGNYSIKSTSAYGPIINVSGGVAMDTITNANHPFANFEY